MVKNENGYYVIPNSTIEVAVTSGTLAPGLKGQQCSRSTVWYRLNENSEWIISPFRSLHETINNISDFLLASSKE